MKKIMIVLIALLIFASVILFGREPVTPGPQDFVAHYFQSWQRTDSRFTPTSTVVNNLWIEFDDDFFAENYLVIFNLTMPTTSFNYVVESVQSNGDIIMAWRPRFGAGGDTLTYWTVAIELNNDFRPMRFNVRFPRDSGRHNTNTRVRTYRRNVRRTAANQYSSGSRQYYIIRHNPLPDDNRPVRILEDIREFHHMWSVIYTIKNDGSLWSWHNNHASGAVISTWIIDDAQVFLNEPFARGFNNSAIDTHGTLWSWDWTRQRISPIMENVRWAGDNLIITNDNSLWSWGDNSYGQVGDGTWDKYRDVPVRIMDNVREAFPMGTHNMALTYDGSLWAWGRNHVGQLGDGTTQYRNSPVMIFQNVLQVSPSVRRTTVVTYDGIWVWGRNYSVPERITAIYEPVQRAYMERPFVNLGNVARTFSQINSPNWRRENSHFAITYSGELWAWGNNEYGQLGDGTAINREGHFPVYIMSGVSELFMGSRYTITLTADGALYAWGRNDRRQLGDGTAENQYSPVRILENIQEVSASNGRNIALTRDGELWLWGSDMHNGRITPTIYRSEHSTRNNRPFFSIRENPFINQSEASFISPVRPIMEGVRHIAHISNPYVAYVIREDDSLWQVVNSYNRWNGRTNTGGNMGFDHRLRPGSHQKIMDSVADVLPQIDRVLVRTLDGEVYSWQLRQRNIVLERQPDDLIDYIRESRRADPNQNSQARRLARDGDLIAFETGTFFGGYAAIDASGGLWVWGNPGHNINPNSGRLTKVMDNAAQVLLRFTETYVLTTDGELWGWGSNQTGNLGDGSTSPRENPVYILSNVKMIVRESYGSRVVAAITHDNTLWAWGFSDNREVGEVVTNPFGPVRVMEDVIYATSQFAITSDGVLWAWRPDSGFRGRNVVDIIHTAS